MTVSNQIQARIQAFTAELERLVSAAAIQAARDALGGSSSASAAPPTAPRASSAAARAKPSPARRGKSGGKRDPKLIEALVARVGAYVKTHEGQGVEAIAAGLNVKTHDITLPITKLLASKTIKKRGEKRATKYFPA